MTTWTKKLIALLVFSVLVLLILFIFVFDRNSIEVKPIEVEEARIDDFSKPFPELGLALDEYLGFSYFSPDNRFFIFAAENKRDDYEYDVWSALYDFEEEKASVVRKEYLFGLPVWTPYGFFGADEDGLFFYDSGVREVKGIELEGLQVAQMLQYEDDKVVVSTTSGMKVVDSTGLVVSSLSDVSGDRPLIWSPGKDVLYFARDVDQSDSKDVMQDPLERIFSLKIEDNAIEEVSFLPDLDLVKVEMLDSDTFYVRAQNDDKSLVHYKVELKNQKIINIGQGTEDENIDVYNGRILLSRGCVANIVNEDGAIVEPLFIEESGVCRDVRLLDGGAVIYIFSTEAGDTIKVLDGNGDKLDIYYSAQKGELKYILSPHRDQLAVPGDLGQNFFFYDIDN